MEAIKRMVPSPIRRIVGRPIRAVRSTLEKTYFEYCIRQTPPSLVFTMGKVGSMSVWTSLQKTYPGVVIHTHGFSHRHHDQKVRRLFHLFREREISLKVISLTRDPIGRNVASFFHNFERDMGLPCLEQYFSLGTLRSLFLQNYRHEIPLQWFDNQLGHSLGIDVYAEPFPECGHAQYTGERVELLVMRSDLPDTEKTGLIKQFLGIDGFSLVNTNIAAEKNYAETYRRFKELVTFPESYVRMMCDSKYFNHFYSQGEIEAIRKKWS
ncbi:MAG: putative capsular polysaccharide synthesis family protein [Gemmataceae bacterium]